MEKTYGDRAGQLRRQLQKRKAERKAKITGATIKQAAINSPAVL